MADVPTHLETLNTIAVRQARGRALFDGWANATIDPYLAQTLRFLAIRAGEHAAAFGKRLCEIGCAVRAEADGGFEGRLAMVQSDAADAAKFESMLGLDNGDGFAQIFDDPTIDPTTGALLGRFIAEERDTQRRLRAARDRVNDGAIDDVALEDIARRLARLTTTVEQLKAMRRNARG